MALTEAETKEYWLLKERQNYLRCEKDLSLFVRDSWKVLEPTTEYMDNWHIDLICEYLTAVTMGQIKRLLIELRFRYMKSLLVSVMWPAWEWIQKPSNRWFFASYSDSLSTDLSLKRRRILTSNWYQAGWHDKYKITTDQNTKTWFENDKQGAMAATSVGGSATGKGGNCLDGETLVKTTNGSKKIKDIKNGELVLTQGEGLCYNRVVATKKSIVTEDLYEIISGNNIVRATGQHKFFIFNKGYIEAENLHRGDRLVTFTGKQNLPTLRERKTRARRVLQRLFRFKKKVGHSCYLQFLRYQLSKEGIRYKKSEKAWIERPVLFVRLFKKTSCNKEQKKMYCLRESSGEKNKTILFCCLQGNNNKNKGFVYEMLSNLWQRISIKIRHKTVLLSQLCRQSTLQENDREEKSSLQGWYKLLKAISRNAKNYFSKRWLRLHDLQKNREDKSPSYQRRYNRQCGRKLDNDASYLPCNTSQVKSHSISKIRRISVKKYPVYDIQIERTGNFFANKVLVHNCLIIDDPIKAEEAFSTANRTNCNTWFDNTFSTRLNDRKNDAIVGVMQRVHVDDLFGHLKKKQYEEEYKYIVLTLPLVAEKKTIVIFPISKKELVREENSLLWEAKDGWPEVKATKMDIGEYGWQSQCQQNPQEIKGNIIKREWFGYYRELPAWTMKYQSWDTAMETKTANDFSVCCTAVECANGYYITDIWKQKVEAPDLERAAKQLYDREKPNEVLIEKKASGHGLIQNLKRATTIPVKPIEVHADKTARLTSVSGLFEAGKVFLPENASWVSDFVEEICLFPNGIHDDQVDAVTQILEYMRGKKKQPSGVPVTCSENRYF
ncbi:MAG: phage terminase large subunit [Pedobacter sp.]|uniref:phage terminase large subunit n=1 Tax=Pedobacter sp. TaxID=1411316 RepID=UPI0035617446